MSAGSRRIFDPLLECYLVGSLDAEARAEVETVLAQSEADQTRLVELRAESEAFLALHPPEPLMERFKAPQQVPRMGARRIPDPLLECYLVGSLDAEARAEVEAALAESEADRARFAELRADSAEFLVQHPPGLLVERFEASRQAWSRASETERKDLSGISQANSLPGNVRENGLLKPGLAGGVGARRISEPRLECSLMGSLDAEACAEVEAMLAESEVDRARLKELQAESAAFLVQYPPTLLVERFEASQLVLARESEPKNSDLAQMSRAISLPGDAQKNEPLKPGLVTNSSEKELDMQSVAQGVVIPAAWRKILTPREAEVIGGVLQGWDDQLIAQELKCARATVRKHLKHIFNKLGVCSRAALLSVANGGIQWRVSGPGKNDHAERPRVISFPGGARKGESLTPGLVIGSFEEEPGRLVAARDDWIDNDDRTGRVTVVGNATESESLFRRAWEIGHDSWPQVDLSVDVFARHLTQRLPKSSAVRSLALLLEQLALADIYLACACVHKVPAAIETLERHYLAKLPASLGYLKLPATVLDEVCQMARIHLLVGTTQAGPQLAGYTGQGTLSRWIQTTAIRMTHKRGDSAREMHKENLLVALEALPAPGPDAELYLIKGNDHRVFLHAVREAFAALSHEQRYLLQYYFVNGLSTSELGKMFGLEQSTVSRLLRGAQQAVYEETKRCLEERFGLSSHEFASPLVTLDSLFDLDFSEIFEEEG